MRKEGRVAKERAESSQPGYFRQGDYKLKLELRRLERYPDPNRGYALGFKDYLEANNRKALTLYRRLSELRFYLT